MYLYYYLNTTCYLMLLFSVLKALESRLHQILPVKKTIYGKAIQKSRTDVLTNQKMIILVSKYVAKPYLKLLKV